MTGAWQVGVDIGGTFADIVAVDPAGGSLRAAKVRTVAVEQVASLDDACRGGYGPPAGATENQDKAMGDPAP